MENTCRTCLNTSIQLLPLFADTKLVAAIETISSIQMIEMKNFPNHICEECVNNINFFLMFQQTIITSDQEIRKRLFGESLKIGSESSENLEHQKQMKIEFDFVAVCNNDQEVHKKLFKEILSIKNELPYIKEINDVKFNDNSTEFVGDKDAVLPKSSFKYTQIDTNENEHNYNEITPSKQNRAEANDFNNESAKKFNSNTDISKNNKNVKQKVRKKLCNICGKSVNYYNIGRHIKSHSDVPAKCKICGKISKNAVGLRDHLYTHKAQEITCHICGKVYKCRKHYKIHMEKHDNIEPPKKFKCSICEKAFYLKADLGKHMRKHTGERPFVCECCGKGLTSSNGLKLHKRIHTNERPFKCELCERAYYKKASLVTHMKTKHSIDKE